MQRLEDFGVLTLGSRLKRLSDLMFRQTDELYKQKGVDLQARAFPILQLLSVNGNLPVTQLADLLGQTHPSISQMSKKLEKSGWLYHEVDSRDERRRMLALTPQGYELVDRLQPLWDSLKIVMERILEVAGHNLIDNIAVLERELAKRSLVERVELVEKQQRRKQVEVIHYEPQYQDDFYRLNRHWLDKYFYLEAIDHEILSNPESNIIEPGGFVLLARLEGKIIGTAALIVADKSRLELSKMSVDEQYQGFGIGEKLTKAAIDQYLATDYSTLYLESSRKLLPALNLYRKMGFIEQEAPFQQSHYSRADIYMEYSVGV
ncbi:bifunctional helix-turn-helix transcriptional regulator/GNAT family N-acetyltransferase [Aliikangiella coralliicola]|uniref:GNAT family N-acetyltransferase n=1 Tax=Aliikangiella coralliicola TaxID=2592383 RepID=A0A545UAV0_9GAMM|nr:bifunctional helix-turn-helix transcriptional regulator/GNAT family N-acetyltransferase [Aliikangiella coralliicola]TQV86590.1 GNAT family N-acetyltransferase [Aliikangiella coralliicola]